MRKNPESKVIYDEHIIAQYGVSVSFINHNSKAMGVIGKNPRRFFPDIVDEFFLKRALASQQEKGAATVHRDNVLQFVDRTMADIRARKRS